MMSYYYPARIEMTLEEFEEIMDWAMEHSHFLYVDRLDPHNYCSAPKWFNKLTKRQKQDVIRNMPGMMRDWIIRRGAEKWLKEE